MSPSLAAVSAFGLRAPETFETAISAGARHMASERLARDMQGYHVGKRQKSESHLALGGKGRMQPGSQGGANTSPHR